MIFVAIIAWLLLAASVASLADDRGRDSVSWMIIATVVSPLLATVALICLPRFRYVQLVNGPNGHIRVDADPSTAPRVTNTGFLVFMTFAMMVFAGGAFLYSRINSRPSILTTTTTVMECGSESMAFIMSQGFVKRKLKAPSTASFPSLYADGVSSSQIGWCKYRVTAYVDSQNSFGAMLRSHYSADLEYLPSDKSWRADDLVIR